MISLLHKAALAASNVAFKVYVSADNFSIRHDGKYRRMAKLALKVSDEADWLLSRIEYKWYVYTE